MSYAKSISLPFATAALAMLGGLSTASAQDNNLTIRQDGTQNSLRVDQSAATNSLVGGVSLEEGFAADPDRTSLETGDDPVAITGVSLTDTATQTGAANTADIELTGDGGRAFLSQTSPDTVLGQGNDASLSVAGNGVGFVAQDGTSNTATLTVNGSSGTGFNLGALPGNNGSGLSDEALVDGGIIQTGDGNTGSVTTDSGTSALLVQNGSGNTGNADTSASAPGTSLRYIQNGNNISGLAPAQVVTNAPGVVTITQTR